MNFRMRIVKNIFVQSLENVSGKILSSAIKTVTVLIAEDRISPETYSNDWTKMFVTIFILKFIIELHMKQVKDVPIYTYNYTYILFLIYI